MMDRTRAAQRTVNLNQIEHGWDVYDCNGEKVGDVSQVESGYLTLSKGFLFPSERYVPAEMVQRVEHDQVYLSISKADLDSDRWNNPPEMGDLTHERRAMGTADTDDVRRMQLREEQLRATSTPVETGEVRLHKDVVSEKETIDVPVSREEVVLERHAVEPRPDDRPIGEGETIRVPIREERAEVEKTPVVYEEVDVGKRAVQETKRVSDTVRREEAVIDHDDDVDVQHRQSGIPHADDRRRS